MEVWMMTEHKLKLEGIDEFLNFKIGDILNREFESNCSLEGNRITDERFHIINLINGVPETDQVIQGLTIKKERNIATKLFSPLIPFNNNIIPNTYNLIFENPLDKPILINTIGASNIKITTQIKSQNIIEIASNIGEVSSINNRFFSINNSEVNYAKVDISEIMQNCVYNYYGEVNKGFFTGITINRSGPLSMNIWEMELLGSNSQCHISGIVQLSEDMKYGTICKIKHRSEKTKSSQEFRHILEGMSYAMYDGESYIAKQATDSISDQKSKTILLSNGSRILNKPRLNIFTGELKATHGASVGKFNEDDIFYLKQRGLNEATIKSVLIKAFIKDLLEKIPSNEIKEFIYEKI